MLCDAEGGLQLRNAVRERKAFEDFKEAKLTHLPYVLGTHPLVMLLLDRVRTYRFATGLLTDQLCYDVKWVLKAAPNQLS